MEILKPEQFDQITAIIDTTVAKFIKELPEKVEARLQSATAHILGFEDRWNKWEVDHCNGRMSTIGNLVSSKVQHAASEAVQKLTFELKADMIPALQRDFDRQLGYALEKEVRDLAEKKAKEIADLLDTNMKVDVAPATPKNVADPKYMVKMPKLGDILMEELVKSGTKKKHK